MPVTLQSRVRRMQVFHLPHEVFCRGRCACGELTVVVVAENPRTGERAPTPRRKKVPGSITLLALERKTGLPAAVLDLAEVKAAITGGYLRIVEQAPDDAGPPAAAAPSVHVSAPATSAPSGASAAQANSPTRAPAPAAATTSAGEKP